MKIVSRSLLLGVSAIALGCVAWMMDAAESKGANTVIVRAHFIGTEQLFASPDGAKLKEIWTLPSSIQFRDHLLGRIAALPSQKLGGKVAPAQTNLLRPLLQDVLARESYLDAVAGPDFALAVRLPEARAQAWEKTLAQAVPAWGFGAAASGNAGGYKSTEWKRRGAPAVLRLVRAGDWTVLSLGDGQAGRGTEWLANIKSSGRPAKATGAWLDGNLNAAQLRGWLPVLANFDNLPMASFSFSNRADFVRTQVKLDFPKPHGWKPEPWQIPTNVIRDPLVSFVAMRGIAPVLGSIPAVRSLGYTPMPNQIIGWGSQYLPFQFNYAAPSKNIPSQMKAIEPKLDRLLLGQNNSKFLGTIDFMTNAQDIAWRGLPLAVPHLGRMRYGTTDYLVLSCYPPMRSTNFPPQQLYAQFKGNDDLVSFDYEITEFRIPHWRQFYQLLEIGTKRALAAKENPGENWIINLMPKLGEAVTEVRATSPTQVTLTRKSHSGFTALELVTLGRWVDSAGFPAFDVFPAQPPKRLPTTAGSKARQ